MKIIILLCFFFLLTIYDNQVTGKELFDIFMMNSLVDKLGIKFEIKNDGPLTENFTCKNMDFLDCYQGLLKVYENDLQGRVVDAINYQILNKLNNYNELVMSLVHRNEPNDNKTSEDEIKDLIEAIRFPESLMYCVIGFLSIFHKNLNDKLTDFIFFNDQIIENQKNKTDFVRLFDDHFKNRPEFLTTRIVKYVSKADNFHKLQKLKTSINEYACPFCDLKFPWINAQSWMWSKLNYTVDLISFIDSEKVKSKYAKTQIYTYNYTQSNLVKPADVTDEDILDYEDNKGSKSVETNRPRESFMSFFQNEYDGKGLKKIDTWYHVLSDLLDSYVSKVLFSSVMQIMAGALKIYGAATDSNHNGDNVAKMKLSQKKNVRVFLYLAHNFELFQVSLQLYNSNRPSTVHQGTMQRMDAILSYAIPDFRRCVQQEKDASRLIGGIMSFLTDERFHRVDENVSAKVTAIVDSPHDLIDKLRDINIYLVHLVELKRQT